MPPPHGGVTEDDIPMLPPADSLEDIFIPIPPRAKVAPSGRSASARVACLAACSGTVRAFPARRPAGAAASGAKALATARFSADAGETVR